MKRFLRNVFLFVGLPVIALVAVSAVVHARYFARMFTLPAQTDVLFVGDSQVVYNIHRSFFPDAVNLAVYSEPHYVSLIKTRHALRMGKGRPAAVVTGLGPHAPAAFCNTGDAPGSYPYNRVRFFPLMVTSSEMWTLFAPEDTLAARMKDLLTGAYNMVLNTRVALKARKGKGDYISGFLDQDDSLFISKPGVPFVAAEIERHYGRKDPVYRTKDAVHERVILEQIQVCRAAGAEMVFVQMPCHAAYLAGVPHDVRARYDEVVAFILAEGGICLDYRDAPLADEHYYDGNHLNTRGSKILGERLKKDIEAMNGAGSSRGMPEADGNRSSL
ncbi:MAG: hypothetical protein FWG50_08130 [Kiritimatiellaeota bacterium]|nr:hypothetical protein [Kiritimatiellota bacterium]